MGNFDFKDKKNIYLIAVILLIAGGLYYVWDYMWNPFVREREHLERELASAQTELDKINAKKHRIAELEPAHNGSRKEGSQHSGRPERKEHP